MMCDIKERFIDAHKSGRNCWARALVHGQNPTKSAKLEFLLTTSSHGGFAITDYG